MAKIYLELRSGLGNQLFQFAFGYTLASEINKELVLCPSYFDPPWRFWLKRILGREARAFRLPYLLPAEYTRDITSGAQVLKKDNAVFILDEFKTDLDTIRSVCSQKGNVYLKGYWQNPDLFSKHRDALAKLIQPTFPLSGKFITTSEQLKENMVAVHVRRGDFLTNRAFGACSLDYYIRSIELIRQKVDRPNFLVFTNDKAWVEEHFPKDIPYTIYSNPLHQNTDIEEMFLMTKFTSLIISNSTFSWWSGYLNNMASRNIICPEKWFLSAKLQLNAPKLVSSGWTVVDNELELMVN